MAKFNGNRFFLLVSLMIFPTRALEVFLANDKGLLHSAMDFGAVDYRIHTKIKCVKLKDGAKTFVCSPKCDKYKIDLKTDKIILYIVSPARFDEIMQDPLRGERINIGRQLWELFRYELFYIAVKDFKKNVDGPVINDFILGMIKLSKIMPFDTIGDIDLELTGPLSSTNFRQYEERPDVYRNKLRARLDAMKLRKRR